MSRRNCDGCGMPIEFITGPKGKPIPAQKVRTVYYLTSKADLAKVTTLLPEAPMYVSHFETCPKASEFSKGRRP